MFLDRATIIVESGRGGNGCLSFRREKFVPRGGPDGGDGGKGGDVYLRANPNISTLYDFLHKPYYKAEDGENGKGKNMVGKDGKDIYIDVPCGTVVYKIIDNNKIKIADLVQPYQTVLVAKGGRGGRGNAAFKSSTNRAPRIAELGQPGETVKLFLELKLIADVGIVGLPNAGKSTLLSVLTAARPKIADYPFTTLYPNLGVCKYDNLDFVLADIPGIIEGAHKGKGLGLEFLRHIERTKIILHLIDVSVDDLDKIYQNYKAIIEELKSYSKKMLDKPMMVVLNKIDLISEKQLNDIIKYFSKKIKNKYPIIPISAIKKQSLDILIKKIVYLLSKIKSQNFDVFSEQELKQQEEKFEYLPDYVVEKVGDKFIVKGRKIEDIVKMTDLSSEESVRRLQRIFKKIGLEKMLKKQGIKSGDVVIISDVEFIYSE